MNPSPSAFEALADRESWPRDRVRSELLAVLSKRAHERGEHDAWSALCDRLAFHDLALRELELAVRDEPARPDLLLALAERYAERGRFDAAAKLVPRARAAGAPEPRLRELQSLLDADSDPASPVSAASPGPQPAEDVPARFLHLFRGRDDVYARQWVDDRGRTGYSPIHDPLTPAVIRDHLAGKVTVGVYPIRVDGTVRFFAVDLDLNKSALEMARNDPEFARELRADLARTCAAIAGDLRSFGLEPLVEDSGYKGRHFWFFLEAPQPADVVFNLGSELLALLSIRVPDTMHLEFFPRQPRAGSPAGLGNLIKLPLGVHLKTRRRSALLEDDGRPIDRPFERLRQVRLLGRDLLYEVLDRLRARTPPIPLRAAAAAEPAPRVPAGPPPPEVPADWTDADFDADPQVSHVLKRCPVLRELKRRAIEHRSLSYDEQLVLMHTLGHVPTGVQATNYLLARCGNVPPERRLKSRLAGNPMSCPKIRARIPGVTAKVDCSCPFDFAPDRYPTPTLHLMTLKDRKVRQGPEAPPDPETIARRHAELLRRKEEIEREAARTAEALADALARAPGRTIRCPGGRYVLEETEGVPGIRWVPEEESDGQDAGGERAGH